MRKRQTGIRLSDQADALINELKKDTGLTTSGIIELAIRELAKARDVTIEGPATVERKTGNNVTV